MKVFLEYTEVITTIIANLVAIPSLILFVFKFLIKRSYKIEFDNEMNLITKQKEIKEMIRDLIIEPDKIKSLDIIIKSKKGKNNTIEDATYNKIQELNLLYKQKIIKRGLHLLVLFPQYSEWDMSIPVVLDEMFIRFIEMYKNKIRKGTNILSLDIFTTVDKDEIVAILDLNDEEKKKLFISKGIEDPLKIYPEFIDFYELEKISSLFKEKVLLGLILKCAINDKLWENDRIFDRDNLSHIFYPMFWKVRLH